MSKDPYFTPTQFIVPSVLLVLGGTFLVGVGLLINFMATKPIVIDAGLQASYYGSADFGIGVGAATLFLGIPWLVISVLWYAGEKALDSKVIRNFFGDKYE